MMRKVKIDFCDFWEGFNKTDNFFYNLLCTQFEVELSPDPDFLIYSNYGTAFYRYKCVRIFYSRENERPDFFASDWAITSDIINRTNHYNFPVFGSRYRFPKLLNDNKNQLFENWINRKEFCSFVVSNRKSKKRIDFFHQLINAGYKQVNSGGRFLNNTGGPVEDKQAFLKQHRFNIAFENSAYKGYTTEKIYDAFIAGCIPVYWGDPSIERYFNPKRFINYNDYKKENELVDYLIYLDQNPQEAKKYFLEPIFLNDELPASVEPKYLLAFFEKIVSTDIVPVSTVKWKRGIHLFKLRKKSFLKRWFNYPEDFR
jgi:hypothetical protein